jgi:hypothetical protein
LILLLFFGLRIFWWFFCLFVFFLFLRFFSFFFFVGAQVRPRTPVVIGASPSSPASYDSSRHPIIPEGLALVPTAPITGRGGGGGDGGRNFGGSDLRPPSSASLGRHASAPSLLPEISGAGVGTPSQMAAPVELPLVSMTLTNHISIIDMVKAAVKAKVHTKPRACHFLPALPPSFGAIGATYTTTITTTPTSFATCHVKDLPWFLGGGVLSLLTNLSTTM